MLLCHTCSYGGCPLKSLHALSIFQPLTLTGPTWTQRQLNMWPFQTCTHSQQEHFPLGRWRERKSTCPPIACLEPKRPVQWAGMHSFSPSQEGGRKRTHVFHCMFEPKVAQHRLACASAHVSAWAMRLSQAM